MDPELHIPTAQPTSETADLTPRLIYSLDVKARNTLQAGELWAIWTLCHGKEYRLKWVTARPRKGLLLSLHKEELILLLLL